MNTNKRTSCLSGLALLFLYLYQIYTSTETCSYFLIGACCTMGMLNGFVIGYSAAAATSSMFWGNLFGIAIGLCLGMYYGRSAGLMGIMDGSMGGVMGGSMGAMIGEPC